MIKLTRYLDMVLSTTDDEKLQAEKSDIVRWFAVEWTMIRNMRR